MGRSAALAALRAAAPVVPPAFPVAAALNLAEPDALVVAGQVRAGRTRFRGPAGGDRGQISG